MPEAGRRPDTSNRRRAFRVLTRLPIRHRRLEREELAAHERELRLPATAAPPEDAALAAWLLRIEAKLDRLAVVLGVEPPPPPNAVEDRPHPRAAGAGLQAPRIGGAGLQPPLRAEEVHDVDLSSAGVGLETAEPLAEGDDVLVECLVPGPSPRHVRALARVARVELQAASRRVALEFRRMADSDRDALVRYTQDVQRCAAL
jgi:hypothetical protein